MIRVGHHTTKSNPFTLRLTEAQVGAANRAKNGAVESVA